MRETIMFALILFLVHNVYCAVMMTESKWRQNYLEKQKQQPNLLCSLSELRNRAHRWRKNHLHQNSTLKVLFLTPFQTIGFDSWGTFLGQNVEFLVKHVEDTGNNAPAFIDFDDGEGYRLVQNNEIVSVSFKTTGEKKIKLKGNDNINVSLFKVESLSVSTAPNEIWEINSRFSYNSVFGRGRCAIFKGSKDIELNRIPLIIVEGFDPLGESSEEALFRYAQNNGIADLLNSQVDIITLNFEDGGALIQINAMVLVELLLKIGSQKRNTQAVVMGLSMGGLVSRYALTYMESKNLSHNVRLFASMDSPQQGANIPLGNQYLIRYVRDLVASAVDAENRAFSSAGKQLLKYHLSMQPGMVGSSNVFTSATSTFTLNPASDSLRVQLYNELNTMGNYPKNLRKVAFSNGSGHGTGQMFPPGADLIKLLSRSFFLDVDLISTPIGPAPNLRVFRGLIDPFGLGRSFAEYFVDDRTLPSLDNAPGSFGTTTQVIFEGIKGSFGEVEKGIPNHECFIPTISSLDIDVNDYFHNIHGDPQILKKTPFDAIYYPKENQPHLYLSSTDLGNFLKEFWSGVVSPTSTPTTKSPTTSKPSTKSPVTISPLSRPPTSSPSNSMPSKSPQTKSPRSQHPTPSPSITTYSPTRSPSYNPSIVTSQTPTTPTKKPRPTKLPTIVPTNKPSKIPTTFPSRHPRTSFPTKSPKTSFPTKSPDTKKNGSKRRRRRRKSKPN